MTSDGRHWHGDEQPRFGVRTALWLALTASCMQLTGCAQPTPQAPSEAASTTASSSDLEQRLRDLQQAEALYLSGRLKEAQAAFERLARTYPNNGEVWFRLGNTLMKEGRFDDAAGALQTAIGLDPGNGRAALNLALSRLAQAQAAADLARSRFAAGTPERQEADAIDQRLKSIFSDPSRGESPR